MPESKTISSAKSSDNAARALQLAVAAAQTAEENRGQDIVVLDVRHLTCMFDYFVIATGTSRRQIHAMSEEIDHKLEDDLNDDPCRRASQVRRFASLVPQVIQNFGPEIYPAFSSLES